MNFNRHPEIEGKHAFLSPSKFHWIRYDEAKITDLYRNFHAAEEGTKLHDFAAHCIRMGEKLQKKKRTLNMYVNDAIDYEMTPELPLYFSRNCFGTTDALAFKNGILRIHDFKSGIVPAHEEQLYIYSALFCLEYDVAPEDIEIINRIYQSNDIAEYRPEGGVIRNIMQKTIRYDAIIEELRQEAKA